MFLIDTNVISEIRKGKRTNRGVRAFFRQAEADASPLYLSVVTVAELRRGVDETPWACAFFGAKSASALQ